MNNILPLKKEKLNKNDLFNEYIMTGLRKEEGVSLNQIRTLFGEKYKEYVKKQLKKHIIREFFYFHVYSLLCNP